MGARPHSRLLPLLIVVIVVIVGACASGGATALDPVGQAGGGDGQMAPPVGVGAEEPAVDGRTTDSAGGTGAGGEANAVPGALRDETRVVYTGSLQLVVDDVDAAVVTASGIVRGAGGYVGASERASDGDNPIATITYRIPADQWDGVLEQLRGVGTKVAGERTSAVEVTGQLVDLEARIRNLRSSETALQAILARAERIADVLEVQRELTQVRGQIEQLDAQRAALADQAAYGTLAVTYGIELLAVTTAAKDWNPGTEIDQALASLMSVLQGLATVGIWFAIVWLPVLLVVVAAVALALAVIRRLGWLRRAPTSAATPTPTPTPIPPAAG